MELACALLLIDHLVELYVVEAMHSVITTLYVNFVKLIKWLVETNVVDLNNIAAITLAFALTMLLLVVDHVAVTSSSATITPNVKISVHKVNLDVEVLVVLKDHSVVMEPAYVMLQIPPHVEVTVVEAISFAITTLNNANLVSLMKPFVALPAAHLDNIVLMDNAYAIQTIDFLVMDSVAPMDKFAMQMETVKTLIALSIFIIRTNKETGEDLVQEVDLVHASEINGSALASLMDFRLVAMVIVELTPSGTTLMLLLTSYLKLEQIIN